MVQRRAARYVCNNYVREEGCVTAMLHELGWRSLQQRRADIRLVFLYKCIHSLVALDLSSYLIPKTRPSGHCNSLSYNITVETIHPEKFHPSHNKTVEPCPRVHSEIIYPGCL